MPHHADRKPSGTTRSVTNRCRSTEPRKPEPSIKARARHLHFATSVHSRRQPHPSGQLQTTGSDHISRRSASERRMSRRAPLFNSLRLSRLTAPSGSTSSASPVAKAPRVQRTHAQFATALLGRHRRSTAVRARPTGAAPKTAPEMAETVTTRSSASPLPPAPCQVGPALADRFKQRALPPYAKSSSNIRDYSTCAQANPPQRTPRLRPAPTALNQRSTGANRAQMSSQRERHRVRSEFIYNRLSTNVQ